MESQPRKAIKVIEPQFVSDGAGVKIRRSIATQTLSHLDPFLLFDHFGSDKPQDYTAGFPMHPHRGIETVTYMLKGFVRHGDTLGNSGQIGPGDVQWMTAGGGIMHEEMPRPDNKGEMFGFQLWVNLPAKLKLSRPRYQEITAASIPVVARQGGVEIRVIAGRVDGVQGPVTQIAADPNYLDVSIAPGGIFTQPIAAGHTAFAYVFGGKGTFGIGEGLEGKQVEQLGLVVLSDGDHLQVRADGQAVRFLLVSGRPLNEPIARYGPFVMNTREEIEQALLDLRNGTFVHKG